MQRKKQQPRALRSHSAVSCSESRPFVLLDTFFKHITIYPSGQTIILPIVYHRGEGGEEADNDQVEKCLVSLFPLCFSLVRARVISQDVLPIGHV